TDRSRRARRRRWGFNPRPREAGDAAVDTPATPTVVSIRARAKRATRHDHDARRLGAVSIRARAKRATPYIGHVSSPAHVSIRARAKRATACGPGMARYPGFQSAPARSGRPEATESRTTRCSV